MFRERLSGFWPLLRHPPNLLSRLAVGVYGFRTAVPGLWQAVADVYLVLWGVKLEVKGLQLDKKMRQNRCVRHSELRFGYCISCNNLLCKQKQKLRVKACMPTCCDYLPVGKELGLCAWASVCTASCRSLFKNQTHTHSDLGTCFANTKPQVKVPCHSALCIKAKAQGKALGEGKDKGFTVACIYEIISTAKAQDKPRGKDKRPKWVPN